MTLSFYGCVHFFNFAFAFLHSAVVGGDRSAPISAELIALPASGPFVMFLEKTNQGCTVLEQLQVTLYFLVQLDCIYHQIVLESVLGLSHLFHIKGDCWIHFLHSFSDFSCPFRTMHPRKQQGDYRFQQDLKLDFHPLQFC